MAPTGWVPIQPQGDASRLLTVTLVLSALCIIVIALRVWCRITTRNFGTEDWLMCTGFIINMVHNAVVSYGTFTGIGTPDSQIPGGKTGPTYMEGMKAVTLWQMFYMSSSVFIKTSICATLLRLSVQRKFNYILWGIIVVTILTTFVTLISVWIQCRPLAASWGEVPGTCMDINVLITLTYVVSALNIATDWSVALLPIAILWKLQMARKVKIAVGFVMGLGVFSSVATIVRWQYSSAYTAPVDYLVGLGNLIQWTVIECDVAIIAGSLPMLRRLVKSLRKDDSQKKSGGSTELVTIGRLGRKKGPVYDTIHESDNLEYFNDKTNESTRNIVVPTRSRES
ncbi:hypothetical protein JX265_008028 [Neoarthrinium moseri]|uniref:Rhodopsin domain-containing protein n=1 Tax=Neoarthrinium moseri TaxID=1658444 RepID=A0A9Q0AP66_9PEZI|nr:hypothetical protein JX266_004640 [Neoarthrinium moseri]KAI1865705.1 hypothetical protein JX265_008028 [Neoarthrinium moseri]